MKQTFWEKLRATDDRTKTRILIVSSGLATAIIIFVWMRYVNGLVGENPATPVANSGDSGFSLWQSMKNGVALIFRGMLEKAKGFGGAIRAPKSYDILPPR